MADLYGVQEALFGGASSADSVRLFFAGVTGVGLLTQSTMVDYKQQMRRFFEVGTRFVYIFRGRATGSFSMNRVLGVRPLMLAFYAALGNPCNIGTNVIDFGVGSSCAAGAPGPMNILAIAGCYAGGTAFQLQSAEEGVVMEQLSGEYISLIPLV